MFNFDDKIERVKIDCILTKSEVHEY